MVTRLDPSYYTPTGGVWVAGYVVADASKKERMQIEQDPCWRCSADFRGDGQCVQGDGDTGMFPIELADSRVEAV